MKKFIKLTIVLLAVLVLLSFYLYRSHIILLKYAACQADVLYPPCDCTVYANEKLLKDAYVFKKDSIGGLQYILWLPEPDNPLKRLIVIVDVNTKKVGIPNSPAGAYDLYFKRYLFQADYAAWFVPFSDNVKGCNFNPKLEITDNISFTLPPVLSGHGKIIIQEKSNHK